jgi:hypothetical protein
MQFPPLPIAQDQEDDDGEGVTIYVGITPEGKIRTAFPNGGWFDLTLKQCDKYRKQLKEGRRLLVRQGVAEGPIQPGEHFPWNRFNEQFPKVPEPPDD